MVVVLAACYDMICKKLVAEWGKSVSLLTCSDFSRKGWRYSPGDEMSTAVISGEVVKSDRIKGVFTRLPSVSEADVGALAPEDRGYGAAEITAFLAAWI